MKISNLNFKKILFSVEPIKEIGIVTLDNEDVFIRFDYRNNIFTHFSIGYEVTDKQLAIAKNYLNEFAESN